MYILPLRFLEVLIVFYLKDFVGCPIFSANQESTNSTACEGHVATMSLSSVRPTLFLIGQTIGKPS